MSDGMFSAKVLRDQGGVASEAQLSASGLEEAIGDPLVIERAPIPKELVVEDKGWRIMNRTSFVSKAWPRQSVMLDELPARGSNVEVAPHVAEGPFWVGEAERRRLALARHGWAYLAHHAQEPQPTADDLRMARKFAEEHRGDAPPERSPAGSVSYQRSQVAGVVMDEASGVGIRTRDPFNTDGADERARRERLAAPPTHDSEGKPLDER